MLKLPNQSCTLTMLSVIGSANCRNGLTGAESRHRKLILAGKSQVPLDRSGPRQKVEGFEI